MRFMICRMADTETEAETDAGAAAHPELLKAMRAYNEQLIEAGALLEGAGLRPSSDGARIEHGEDGKTVLDGPFTESKELLAGYTLIEADSRDEAIEWVMKWPPLDGDGEVELQLREVIANEEFEQLLSPEQKQLIRRNRELVAANRRKAGMG